MSAARDRRRADWLLSVLEALAALAGFAALAFVPGVSGTYVLVASTLLVLGVNVNVATGWALPDAPARLLNALALAGLFLGVTMLSSGPARLAHASHALLLLLVLRTFQRKRPWDDFLLLVGPGGALALASFGIASPIFLPCVLAGTLAAAGGALRLVVSGVPPGRLDAEEPGAGPAAARGWLGVGVLAGRLVALLVLASAALFVLIPRPPLPEEPGGGPIPRPAELDAASDAPEEEPGATSVGFRPEITLGDIGKLKRNMRIAFNARVYRDRQPYRLAPDEAYWRGVVLRDFDGRRWTPGGPTIRLERSRDGVRGDFLELMPPPGDAEPAVHEMEQQIQLEPMAGTSALFALYRPWLVDPGEDGAALLAPGDAVVRIRPHETQFVYRVASLVPRPGVDDPWREVLTPAERSGLTRLPPGSERIRRLAEAVAGDARGPAAATRLADHLRARCRYTLDLPSLDRERPVEDFLFRVREGHCELFATALALLLRARDVPCRLVAGFRGGDYSEDQRVHTVRFSNAHAWVEAHFPGRGWILLDATPPDAEATAPGAVAAAGEPGAGPDPLDLGDRVLRFDRADQRRLAESARQALRWLEQEASGLGRTTLGLLGAALVAGAAFLLTLRRPGRAPRDRGPGRPAAAGPGGDAVRRAYLSMVDTLGRRGVRRTPAETPRELARRAAREVPAVSDPVSRLTALHQASCYGGRPAEKEDARRAAGMLAEVRLALKRPTLHRPASLTAS